MIIQNCAYTLHFHRFSYLALLLRTLLSMNVFFFLILPFGTKTLIQFNTSTNQLYLDICIVICIDDLKKMEGRKKGRKEPRKKRREKGKEGKKGEGYKSEWMKR